MFAVCLWTHGTKRFCLLGRVAQAQCGRLAFCPPEPGFSSSSSAVAYLLHGVKERERERKHTCINLALT